MTQKALHYQTRRTALAALIASTETAVVSAAADARTAANKLADDFLEAAEPVHAPIHVENLKRALLAEHDARAVLAALDGSLVRFDTAVIAEAEAS